METRKEKRKRSTEPRAWKRPKAITWDEATGCPSSLWQPYQGVVSFVPTHTSRGWGPTTILRAPSLDSPVKALPHTEVFLDTSDPADQTQKHNACQGGNTALGTERVLIPHHLHLHTWVAPSSCNPSPFTNLAPYSGHASSSPPLVFLEDEATFPGLQAFFFSTNAAENDFREFLAARLLHHWSIKEGQCGTYVVRDSRRGKL